MRTARLLAPLALALGAACAQLGSDAEPDAGATADRPEIRYYLIADT